MDQKNNQKSVIHGGAGAERRLTTGQPLIGVARETEVRVSEELNVEGLASLYRARCIRLQTVADLYYQAILGAEDMTTLDRYVNRFGWIQASALRAFIELRKLEKENADLTSRVLEAVQRDE